MIKFEEDTGPQRGHMIDMTPMVDIIFTIIAFMMLIINAPMLTMQLDLPKAGNTEFSDAATEDVTLYVLDDSATWQVGDSPPTDRDATTTALQKRLASGPEDTKIIIAIAQSTPTQRLIETLDLLESLGVTNVEIMTEASDDAQP